MFKKAERKAAFLRAAFCGTSGSGKTMSSILLARGLAGDEGKIALIDTERGSASLYSDVAGGFDVAELSPPYSPKRYIQLIKDAASQYDVLIIDSLTHGWAGMGGILEMHDNATKTQKNSYMAWRDVTPEHNALVDAILACQCHLICTMRSKTAYEIQDNNGKKTPIKVGMAPIQRDGMEYEFTVVWDVMVESNVSCASKDRTQLWKGRNEVITIDHGVELKRWLAEGGRFDEADLSLRLSKCESKEDFTALWRSLMVRNDHPQYQTILRLFTDAKERVIQSNITQLAA
jgi:hypothetical protein